jgi:hypothetical protein
MTTSWTGCEKTEMDATVAQRVVESLRKGIPPEGFIRQFTVGREAEIKRLIRALEHPDAGALLLMANYGSGKTHLLRYIREHALANGYAVSSVSLDARNAVRFNRMDQIFGAICRGIEVPGAPGKGLRPFLDLVTSEMLASEGDGFWQEVSNSGKWDYSTVFESAAFYVALRAWATRAPGVTDLVEDWFGNLQGHLYQRSQLYYGLVAGLTRYFHDPRPEFQFYSGVFDFRGQAYEQTWSALRDMNTVAKAAGLKGLIILFDEFEDIITNLRNISYQESAFWNLFTFYAGEKFTGTTFFAVTPEFSNKCKTRLIERQRWHYDYQRFDHLPTFQMSPLRPNDLFDLAEKIADLHGLAYGWKAAAQPTLDLRQVTQDAVRLPIEDRARHAITETVKALDQLFQDLP